MEPITLQALGTTWWVELFHTMSTERRDGLQASISTLLLSIETRFSRFRPDSLVSELNTKRTLCTDDTDLATLIGIGRDLYRHTRGNFNILIGDELLARGYDAEYSLQVIERPVAIGNPLTDLDYSDGAWQLTTGLLDLGGIGKGWAIDMVAALLTAEGVTGFLINAGGDMYGTSEQGEPITIFLEHPTEADTYIGTTSIQNQGFAASSPHKRRWKTVHGETSHIVGDTTLHDASFVIARDAVTADTLATCALLLVPDEFAVLAAVEQVSYATLSREPANFYRTADFPFKIL
ncbi:MAG: FAD:protein FMN transferase [Candidatus Pacebacteria bacterium]|jgi:thiamine biosynthesis lipoprotein|nr:FAD:protein FMN transferase [Candidatus Paceibacterota bacterium]